MINEDVVSKHFTKVAAVGKCFDLNREAIQKGHSRAHSSGWGRLDYGVRKNPRRLTLNRWHVFRD